jgi:hypothetical protein
MRIWPDEKVEEQLLVLRARLAQHGIPSFAEDVEELLRHGAPRVMAGIRAMPRPLRLADVNRLARESKWIVRGIVERGSVVLVYGPPGAMKTFVTLDLSLRLAHGRQAWGKPVRATPVAYFSGEGQRSVARRILAWLQRHAHAADVDAWFRLIGDVPNLGDPASIAEVLELVADLRPGLLILDTLSTACPGIDENSAGELVQVLRRCREIARPFEAAVLLVHHSSKDRKSARGSSVLTANVDVVLRVEANPRELVATITCEKARDDALPRIALQLERQSIEGLDDAGDPMPSTLVVSEVREAPDGVHDEFIEFIEGLRKRSLPQGLSSSTFLGMAVSHELFEAGEATRKALVEAVLEHLPEFRPNSVRNCLTALRRGGWAEPDIEQKTSSATLFRPSPAATAFFESACRSSSDERR